MAANFPRLLVATEAWPNAPGGGLAIIRQMLKLWPTDRLLWWSCFPDRDKQFGQQVAGHRVARIPLKLYPHKRCCIQKSWLLEHCWSPWAIHHFQKTLELLKPEVVWVIPHGWSIPSVARVMPHANLGFHVSIHDYADLRGTGARYGVERSRRLALMADQLYAAATTRDAICQAMADDLRTRTGGEGLIIRAGLEQEDFDYLARKPGDVSDSIRIAFAGTILVESEFAIFARALARIRQQLPKHLWLDFYGDSSYCSREWFDGAWMREHGRVPAPELSEALKECTWGFAPMGLTDDDPRYNRFSLPTKFASYLTAGLPVITLGHPESSIAKMASSYKVGVCMTTGDPETVSADLLAALSDPNPWLTYRTGIQRCAEMEFDALRMRAVLYESFQKCAARSRESKSSAFVTGASRSKTVGRD